LTGFESQSLCWPPIQNPVSLFEPSARHKVSEEPKEPEKAGWLNYRPGRRDPLLEDIHNNQEHELVLAQVKATLDERRRQVEAMEKPGSMP